MGTPNGVVVVGLGCAWFDVVLGRDGGRGDGDSRVAMRGVMW